jgi:hypothetical protein
VRYHVGNGEYVDMIKAGIVDRFKIVRTALVDASRVASLLTVSEMCVWSIDDADFKCMYLSLSRLITHCSHYIPGLVLSSPLLPILVANTATRSSLPC